MNKIVEADSIPESSHQTGHSIGRSALGSWSFHGIWGLELEIFPPKKSSIPPRAIDRP